MPDSLTSLAALQSAKRTRLFIAALLLLLAAASFFFFRYQVTVPSSAVIHDTVGDASITFAADRTIVWQGGDCVTLSWQVEGIDEVFLGNSPAVGEEQRAWCLWPESLAARPNLRVHFTDDTWKDYGIEIEVMHPLLLYSSVPLVIAAAWVMQLGFSLPASLRQRLTDERRKLYWFTEPFLSHGTFDLNLIYLFVLINGLVLFNVVRHNPQEGYDAGEHFAYIDTLAEFRLPDPTDTYEYFSPPLAYIIPAAITRVVDPTICSIEANDCREAIQKAGQLQTIFLSLGITFFMIKLVGYIRPGQPRFKMLSLAMLGILPVYYKSLTFMHGEPFLAFFSLVLIYLLVEIFTHPVPHRRSEITAGIVMGLLLLSRQWGAFIIVGAMLWLGLLALKSRAYTLKAVRVAFVTSLIAVLVGGWFYLSLQLRFGSAAQFNREASSADQAPEFFGFGNGALFTAPYRHAFEDQILPKFYTEIWGDYEGYFITYQYETPRAYLLSYLGRVNAVSLFPTSILLAGILVGAFYLRKFVALSSLETLTSANALLFLCIVVSLLGYLGFIIRYPPEHGDTIKAGYMLQIFPLIAILSAEFLEFVRRRQHRVYAIVLLLLGFVLLHNLPAMMTRRTEW